MGTGTNPVTFCDLPAPLDFYSVLRLRIHTPKVPSLWARLQVISRLFLLYSLEHQPCGAWGVKNCIYAKVGQRKSSC